MVGMLPKDEWHKIVSDMKNLVDISRLGFSLCCDMANEKPDGTLEYKPSLEDMYKIMIIEIYKTLCVNSNKDSSDKGNNGNANSHPTD